MTHKEIETINRMLADGIKITEISKATGICANTIKTHYRRHRAAIDKLTVSPESLIMCKGCNKPIAKNSVGKPKQFCSDKCRMSWWNSHRELVKHGSAYYKKCAYCGKEYISNNKSGKYCSRECFANARRKDG